jgi:DNA-binding MarR family transcriptional regulator
METTLPPDLSSQKALSLWSAVIGDSVRAQGPDLSARQMAIMLSVYLDPPARTVRLLAAELEISKLAVTRALDVLSKLGFVRRARDPDDKRSVLIHRTVKGSVYLSEFSDLVIAAVRTLEA